MVQAEELYLKLTSIAEFPLNLIEIKRIRALLKSHSNPNDAKEMMKKNMVLAGEKNLAI